MSLCNDCNQCNTNTNTNVCNTCTPCTGPTINPPSNPTLIPIRTKRILNCINLDDRQCKFLGEFTFNITCNSSDLTDLPNNDICINTASISYDFIGIQNPNLTVIINGKDVILSGINPSNGLLYDQYEGVISPGILCCCPNSTNCFNNIISISGIEMSISNAVITVCGTIGCRNITAETAYDGPLNSSACSSEVVNLSQALQNATLLDTSSSVTTTILPVTGILNQFNSNSYFGGMCLPSLCRTSNLSALFENQVCITCVQPTQFYNNTGSFTANLYGCFISNLNLISTLKENYPIYSESYNGCTNSEIIDTCNTQSLPL